MDIHWQTILPIKAVPNTYTNFSFLNPKDEKFLQFPVKLPGRASAPGGRQPDKSERPAVGGGQRDNAHQANSTALQVPGAQLPQQQKQCQWDGAG
jgi:hypothetical protein